MTLGYRYLNATGSDPSSAAHVPRELHFSLNVTNTGPRPLPLAGVRVPIVFNHSVFLPSASECARPRRAAARCRALHVRLWRRLAATTMRRRWVQVPGDQFVSDCFYAAVTSRSGAPVGGLGNACEWISLNMTGAPAARAAPRPRLRRSLRRPASPPRLR